MSDPVNSPAACQVCKGSGLEPCTACGGRGSIAVSYPGGGESELRCDVCRGSGQLPCSRCRRSPPSGEPEPAPAILNQVIVWRVHHKKDLIDPEDDWNAGPFFEYESAVSGQLWEIQRIGDVAARYRLLVDGEPSGDFPLDSWPAVWQRPRQS